MIMKFDVSMMPVVMFSIKGNIDPKELDKIAEDFADRLQRVPGVAGSYALSNTTPEVQIIFDPARLSGTGISIEQVVNILKAQNLNYPLGLVETGTRVYNLRVVGEYKDLKEIGKTVIGNQKGVPVLLNQVAEIHFQPQEQRSISKTNGIPSILGMVQKRVDANTVNVCNGVLKMIEEQKRDLPSGVSVDLIFNQADFINRSIKNTANTLIVGAILAIVILFLFFGNLRSTIFVAISLPITVFFALFMMFIFKMNVNMISLSGLTIAIGMVVDCAIVVFEAIYRHLTEKGENSDLASILGTKEVGMAITASTLTTIAVFLPLLLVRGFASVFFNQLAWTVTFALVSSLVVALTIVPMLTAKFLKLKKEPGPVELFVKNYYKKIENFYLRIIRWALNHRRTTIFGTAGLFVISLFLLLFIGAELTPEADQGQIQIQAEMPVGTNLATTDSAVNILAKIISEEVPEMRVMSINVGAGTGITSMFSGQTQGSHTASITIRLVPREERKRTAKQIQHDLRAKINSIPGLLCRFTSQTTTMLLGTGTN